MLEVLIKPNGDRIEGHGYLWLKKVVRFDDTKHCAQCLVGSYEVAFGVRAAMNRTIRLPRYQVGDIIYVCGVSKPYRWDMNRHLAARIKPMARCKVELHDGSVIYLEGAQEIPFDDHAARNLYPDRSERFLSCRNFQFGAQHFASSDVGRRQPELQR